MRGVCSHISLRLGAHEGRLENFYIFHAVQVAAARTAELEGGGGMAPMAAPEEPRDWWGPNTRRFRGVIIFQLVISLHILFWRGRSSSTIAIV